MTDKPTIEVLYTCDKCGAVDRTVKIEERGDGEDIRDWMHRLTVALSRNHDQNSPGCHVSKFANVKIPLAPGDNTPLGRAARH